MKALAGWAILAAVFIGIMWAQAQSMGWAHALLSWAIALALMALMALAVWLVVP